MDSLRIEKRYVWQACSACGKRRHVRLHKGGPVSKQCRQCSGKAVARTRKGVEARARTPDIKYNSWDGYVEITVEKDSPYLPMARKGRRYIKEHRLVVAKALGRCLKPYEVVHHKNGIKDDNRIENLILMPTHGHRQITILEQRIKHLEGLLKQHDIQY